MSGEPINHAQARAAAIAIREQLKLLRKLPDIKLKMSGVATVCEAYIDLHDHLAALERAIAAWRAAALEIVARPSAYTSSQVDTARRFLDQHKGAKHGSLA